MAEQVHVEQGYTRLANQLLDAVCQVELSGRQFRVFMTIVRKTYGFNKSLDWISAEQIKDLMNYGGNYTHICSDIRELKSRQIIIQEGRKLGPNPYLLDWILDKKGGQKPSPKVTENGHKNSEKCDQKRSQKGEQLPLIVTENGHIENSESDRKRSPMEPKTVTFCDRKRSPQKTKDNNTKDIKRSVTYDNFENDDLKTPKKRSRKPPEFLEFYNRYPIRRRGGTSHHAWKVWNTENLKVEDAQKAIDWLLLAAEQNHDWRVDSNCQFVVGITKFIRERRWLTPTPLPNAPNVLPQDFDDNGIDWAGDVGL